MSHRASMSVRGSLIALMIGIAPGSIAASQAISPAAPQSAAPIVPVGTSLSISPRLVRAVIEDARTAAAAAREEIAIEAQVAALDPGEYLWRPDRARAGGVEIVVSLERQMAYVYRGGTLIAATTVSTGRRGHRTPTGSFTILEKNREHYSNLYNNAPMPFMQRLTWDGIALHAGALPGYPASHGCVRLPLEFSRLLFGVTSHGSTVHIVEGAPPSAHAALAFATGRQPASAQVRLASAR